MPINKEYKDWDGIVVQLNNGTEGLVNVRMMRQDLEVMYDTHGSGIGDVLELMVQALEEELAAKETEPENAGENAES